MPELIGSQESRQTSDDSERCDSPIPGPPPLVRWERSMQERQLDYLHTLDKVLEDTMTVEQRSKFCLIFGHRIIAEFDTVEQATTAQNTEFDHLSTVLVLPAIVKTIDQSKQHRIDQSDRSRVDQSDRSRVNTG